jgi:hypothetical protein
LSVQRLTAIIRFGDANALLYRAAGKKARRGEVQAGGEIVAAGRGDPEND